MNIFFKLIVFCKLFKRCLKRKLHYLKNTSSDLENNYFIFNPQQFLVLITAFFLIFWLSSPLNYFFNSYVVEYGLGWLPSEPLGLGLGLVYILLVGILTYKFHIKYHKSNYKPSLLLIGSIIIICLIYLNERFLNKQYNLTPVFRQDYLKHFPVILDPIYIVLFSFAVSFIYNGIRLRIPSRAISFINPDQPIINKSFDEFERKEFVEKFSEIIDNILVDSKQSFVIGINGFWGSGKSSLLYMIENELDKDSIKIRFNPWITSNNANLVQSFFDLLDDSLSQYIATQNLFKKYGKGLTKIDHDKNFLKPFQELFHDESLQDSLNKITKLIKKIHKTVYVFIDDIDRLNKEEVFEVLRLIRNSACFPNMIFIVAYDRKYLEKALQKYKIPIHRKYLEKIIQLEIKVPAIQNVLIQNILMNELKNKIPYLNLKVEEEKEVLTKIERMIFGDDITSSYDKFKIYQILNDLFSNKRDIVRFANSFVLRLIISYKNVYLPDLFILELIKFYNLDLYSIMERKENLYAVYYKDGTLLRIFALKRNKEKDKDLIYDDPKLLEIINDKFKSDNILITLLNALISDPYPGDSKSDLGIYYDDYYDSYFTLASPKNVVTTEFINDLIKSSEE